MEITGIVLKKSEVQIKTDTFRVQHFYLDSSKFDQFTGEKRENFLKMQVINNRITDLEKIAVGTRVKVSFSIRGRFFEYEGEKKHAQDLTAWNFEVVNQNGALTEIPKEKETNVYDTIDDLPF